MSAKEYYRTAPILLPDLPPEIWLSIFRLATWSTDIFNPQLMVLAGCDTAYRENLREFKRSLVSSPPFFCWDDISPESNKVTKRYLVRVCKAWYRFASPFLFEYIFLGRGRVLAPLRDGMLRPEQPLESQDSPHTIGRWTQRIDVHIRDRTDDPDLIMDILADILRQLPNLRILTFAVIGHGYNFYYLPENVLQATNACCNTLRLLYWYGGPRPSSDAWKSFLENHTRLEAINAPVALTQLGIGNSHIVLNSLKSVYVHCRTDPSSSLTKDELWNIDLPAIHHAIYDLTWTTQGFNFEFDDFLPKIGPKLTSIQINCLKSGVAIAVSFYNVFSRIMVTCTNLARVDIVTHDWLMPPSFFFPRTVHTLGISINVRQMSKRSVEALFGYIHDFLFLLPSMKTICFMDGGNVRALHAHPQTLRSCLARIIILDVNVMDHEGRPLV